MRHDNKTKGGGPPTAVPETHPTSPTRSSTIASGGIRTTRDVQSFSSALLADLMTGAVDVRKANAACNVLGKMLGAAELEQRILASGGRQKPREVVLVDTEDDSDVADERVELRRRLAELDTASGAAVNGRPATARK